MKPVMALVSYEIYVKLHVTNHSSVTDEARF